jgi:predicted RecB family nuclease
MKLDATAFRLSATDLANHLACRHLTGLDRGEAEGRWPAPDWFRPEAALLRERGLEHERAYLAHLEAQGRRLSRPGEGGGEGELHGHAWTAREMMNGADVIVQATLAEDRWLGRADVLLRVERKSDLGDWSYEALDTKLARETKGGTILQLCLYSDLLARIQGVLPERMHVVPRGPGLEAESYRVEEYLAYYRFVRRRLEAELSGDLGGDDRDPPGYPDPVAHCDICRWWPRCDRRRRLDDHLSLVAGISRVQTLELQSRAVATLARLAVEPLPIAWRPSRGARDGYGRVREQARVQLAGRGAARVLHELLPPAPGRGLAALPAPSPGDLFLDLEGNPYVDGGGLEYLFGWAVAGPAPSAAAEALPLFTPGPSYERRWALDRAAERSGFEALIDTIVARWEADPGMHVYHFGAYEPAALKRLMGRHATREVEIDRLLRAGRFVDLHAVVKHALRASVEEYSIKKLEPLYGFVRAEKLENAGPALRVMERDLELGRPVDVEAAEARVVEAYNRDDCLSARALRDWLEELRAGLVAEGAEIERPAEESGDAPEVVGEREARTRALVDRLRQGVPDDPAARSGEEQARWLLSNLLEWHRREEKSVWWERYRLEELSDEELLDERAAISGLEFMEVVPAPGRAVVHRYRFPGQESEVRRGDKLRLPKPDAGTFGKVEAIDPVLRTVDIVKPATRPQFHPTSVFRHDFVPSDTLKDSLLRLAEWVADHGVDAPGSRRAARDLLLRRPPRLADRAGGPLVREGEDPVAAACRLAGRLEGGTLAIQGPPGTGKTHTGAEMITALVRAGKTVGICALSHKVITNLMRKVGETAARSGVEISRIQKVRERSGNAEGIDERTDSGALLTALRTGGAQVAGGTSWLWADPDFFGAVDVLFVDEAGQMSLANVLALAQGGVNLVLLGDPRQLEQPIQGTHPDGAEVSALDHVLGEDKTIALDRGLFLTDSYRLAPSICRFTSESFYEGRLHAREELAHQELLGETPFAGAGLWFVPCEHGGNQNSSPEEVARVVALVEHLAGGGVRWRDRFGEEHVVGLGDVLVIAPYNAQVSDLAERLPAGARVGTVDKFQGQEAPVVIYSMTTSTPEDVPHGMEFLYSPNRFNVATSRARCACIVVGSPRLFEPDCRSPKQMRLANAFCRYLEMARVVAP